jgi:hypothetical protein
VARAKLLSRRKWTDERGNLYEIVLWHVDRNACHSEGVRYRLALIRSGEDAPRFCMTIIIRRAITGTLAAAKRHTPSRRRDNSWQTSSLTRAQRRET